MAIEAFSWTREDDGSATKHLDKSAFEHRGTGVPREILEFFPGADRLAAGERLPIALLHGGVRFSARLSAQRDPTLVKRVRLFWSSSFSTLLATTFPRHSREYAANLSPESPAVLRLRRDAGTGTYEVSFAADLSEASAARDVEAAEVEDAAGAAEGAPYLTYGRRFERSVANRQAAIRLHGLSCQVCGFNFARVYGPHGADYIEVHHLRPLATQAEGQTLIPRTDLVTLCANCHRMVHRDPKNVLSVEDLREMVHRTRAVTGGAPSRATPSARDRRRPQAD